MTDIYIGFAIQAILCAGLFFVAARLAKRCSRKVSLLLGAGAILAGACYALFLRESVFVARMLPFSNLIVLGNWLPLAAAFLAGIAWRLAPGNVWRRCWPVVGLGIMGALAVVQPILGRPPECTNQWDDDNICRQTLQKTCTPACAATLLRTRGIEASEQEMAELCLTRQGTTWYGLFRGLKIKTRGTPYDVEVFSCTADQLREMTPDALILSTGLPKGAKADPIYSNEWGWRPGELHTVLLFDFVENDRVEMADPDVGREQWTVDDLRLLWRGRGMRLAPR